MTEVPSAWIVSGGILIASFLGSWHCAGMCGPVASLMARRQGLTTYHIGRLISYTGLGALGAYFGNFFLEESFVLLRWIAACLFAAVLFFIGLSQLRPQIKETVLLNNPLSFFFKKTIAKIQHFTLDKSPLVIGLLTALLPCGWLYSYVLAAVATRDPFAGALVMFFFWLGGLPALYTLPLMVKATIAKNSERRQKIAGGILILASFYTLISFYYLHQ